MVDIGLLDKRVNDSLDLLRDTYSRAAVGGGWYHELGSPPGFTATAVGLLAFTESGRDFENFDEALDFLQHALHGDGKLVAGERALAREGPIRVAREAAALRELVDRVVGPVALGHVGERT